MLFYDLFPDGLFLLVLVMIWIVLTPTRTGNIQEEPMPAGESVGWLFLCIPLAGFVLAKWKTNAFLSRYFISALPGIAVAFSCWSWRQLRDARRVSIGIFLILATWGAAKQMRTALHPDLVDPNGQ